MMQLWDVPLFVGDQSTADGPFNGRFIVAILILLVGYIVLEIARVLVNRQLTNEHSDAFGGTPQEVGEGPDSGASVSRLSTILPPLSWALQAAIMVVTLLTALGQLGVNVSLSWPEPASSEPPSVLARSSLSPPLRPL